MASTVVVATTAGELDGGPPLALNGVERRWGDRPILAGASLRIETGTIAWLGGRNGAGKTTLLRVIAGLVMPHAGSVALCGLHPERDRRAYQRHLGYVAAGDRGLYARLTARQNLEFWAGLALIARDRRATLIDRAIDRFDLAELADRRVDRLSMGQRQRVRLAMGFVHEPSLILLDEPDASLDDATVQLLDRALAELAAGGGAALWCSPMGRELPLHADHRYLLDGGRIGPG